MQKHCCAVQSRCVTSRNENPHNAVKTIMRAIALRQVCDAWRLHFFLCVRNVIRFIDVFCLSGSNETVGSHRPGTEPSLRWQGWVLLSISLPPVVSCELYFDGGNRGLREHADEWTSHRERDEIDASHQRLNEFHLTSHSDKFFSAQVTEKKKIGKATYSGTFECPVFLLRITWTFVCPETVYRS